MNKALQGAGHPCLEMPLPSLCFWSVCPRSVSSNVSPITRLMHPNGSCSLKLSNSNIRFSVLSWKPRHQCCCYLAWHGWRECSSMWQSRMLLSSVCPLTYNGGMVLQVGVWPWACSPSGQTFGAVNPQWRHFSGSEIVRFYNQFKSSSRWWPISRCLGKMVIFWSDDQLKASFS